MTLLKQVIQLKFPMVKEIGNNWADMVTKFKKYKPRLFCYAVKWYPPTQGRLKCNTDGDSKGNLGQGAYGLVARGDERNLIYAQAGGLGFTTNMIAEMTAILEVVRLCALRNWHDMEIESNSLALVNIVRNVWRIPWEMIEAVDEIRNLMSNINATITHIYREGNTLADYSANLATQSEHATTFNNFQQLPTAGRKILNMDKMQIPNLRIRPTRINPYLQNVQPT